MIDDIAKLVGEYQKWLKARTTLREIDGYIEITTPYLDRHNDFIQIYARKDNGSFILTDGSETIEDLRISGCNLDSPKRQGLLKVALSGFGVQKKDDEIFVQANTDNFSLKKHSLIQAILAVNDLFYLAQPHVASLFLEDVTSWLQLIEIRFMPNVKFSGMSGFDHMFDFGVPKSRNAPERIIKALNNPTQSAATALAFAWIDTKDVRPADSEAFAFLNDTERHISSSIGDALKNYSVVPVPWSQRETVRERLSA